jgi:hypothetical protein
VGPTRARRVGRSWAARGRGGASRTKGSRLGRGARVGPWGAGWAVMKSRPKRGGGEAGLREEGARLDGPPEGKGERKGSGGVLFSPFLL